MDEHVDDGDEDVIVLNARDLLAHVWAIAARLVELNPDLRVSRVDHTRDSPIYIVHDDAEELRIQFDLVASVWLSAPGIEPVEYSWLDLIQTDLPDALVSDLQELGAISANADAQTTRRSATYRLISQILDMEAHSAAHWTVPNLTVHFQGQERVGWYPGVLLRGVHEAVDGFVEVVRSDVDLMGERRVHQPLWVLERDLEQVVVLDSRTAKVHLRDEVIEILGEPGSEPTSLRTIAVHVLENAKSPHEPRLDPEEVRRLLEEFEDSILNPGSPSAAASQAWLDLVKTLAAAGLDAPPLGEFDADRIAEYGNWQWGSRSFPASQLYMFDFDKVMSSSKNAAPFFALVHAGHGANSYGLNLVTSKGSLVVFVQHHWGGAYGDPDLDRESINDTYARIRDLFDRIDDPFEEPRLGLLFSNFRGMCGVVDLDKFLDTNLPPGSASNSPFAPDREAQSVEELFELAARELGL